MKKILILFLVVAILASMMCPVVAASPFTDVSAHWAENYILQAAERKLVNGYNGLYRPDDSMTRAELVTILWRAVGEPKPAKASSFTDLTQDWYKDAVAWAQETGVIKGVSEDQFGPTGNVTREQLATVLHRMAGSEVGEEAMWAWYYDQMLADAKEISSYAKSAIYWCIYNKVYCGEAAVDINDTLVIAPKADANRGQIAVMMIRYLDRNN